MCRDWSDEWVRLVQWIEEKERKQAKRRASSSRSCSGGPSSKKASAKAKPNEGSAITVITDERGRPSMSLTQTLPIHSHSLPTQSPATSTSSTTTSTTTSVPVAVSAQVNASVISNADTQAPSVSSEVIDPGASSSQQRAVDHSANSAEVIDLSALPGPSGISASHSVSAIRDILLASDSGSFVATNLEQEQESSSPVRHSRSRSRKRSHKGKHRRRRHSSSSSSSYSPSPKRKRKEKPSRQGNSDTLSQILNLLSNLSQSSSPPVQPAAKKQTSNLDSAQSAVDSQPLDNSLPLRGDPTEEGSGDFLDTDSQDPVDPVDLLSVADLNSQTMQDVSSSDDEPLYGTNIPEETFNKAVDILRLQLGFDSPETDKPPSKSKLSLNKPVRPSRATLPVDAECEDRYKAAASARKWSAYSRAQLTSFRVDEKEWRSLFRVPNIPQAAEDYLRSVGAIDQSGKWKSTTDKRHLKSLQSVDAAARAGLKYSSSLLLVAEVLMKSFQTSEVSKKDTATLVNLVGPLARRVYDQFARVSVKAVMEQRESIVEAMRLPQRDIKRRFLELPVTGEDLFGGQFDEQLQSEVKRRKDMLKASFNVPRSLPSTRARRTQGFSQRRPPFNTSSFVPRRPQPSSSQPRRTQRGASSRTASRGFTRGSKLSRGRGFSKP